MRINRISIRRFLPRSLFARAALILFVPVVVVQISISVGIIQRIYEDATTQMTQNAISKIELILDTFEKGGDFVRVADALDIGASTDSKDIVSSSNNFDYSGRIAAALLHERFPTLSAADMNQQSSWRVLLEFETPQGRLFLDLTRRQVTASNPHQLLVLVAGLSLLMVILSWSFLASQLRPLRELAQSADAYGRGQINDFQSSGATEIRVAGDAFLTMRERIEQHMEQRNLILTGVSHDLKTPLTRLKLEAAMNFGDADNTDMLRDIDEMEGLIKTFLEFVESDLHEETSQFELTSLLDQIVDEMRASGANVTVKKKLAAELEIASKKKALTRALKHLIDNAVTYGNTAEVTCSVEASTITITVEDDGPGIPQDQRLEALKPFSRLDPARNQNSGSGVGLGLSIIANSIRACTGTLDLNDSETMGGMSARIVLPLQQTDAA